MKDLHLILFFAVAIAALPVGTAYAQHEGHQVSAPAPSPAITPPPNAGCAEAARKAVAIINAIHMRTGADPTGGEAADRKLAELQRAVAAAQAELFVCQAAVPAEAITPAPAKPMPGMDHSKMNMGTPAPGAKPASPGTKPADPMAGMDHSKMKMGTPAPGAKPASPGTKPADPMAGMDHSKMKMGTPAPGAKPASPGTKPADPMVGMDHSKMKMGTPAPGAKPAAAGAKPAARGAKPPAPGSTSEPAAAAAAPTAATPAGGAGKLPVMMAERIADPACPDSVGRATAPRAVFERKVYYFCSVAARDEFRKDPAAYLKKHPR